MEKYLTNLIKIIQLMAYEWGWSINCKKKYKNNKAYTANIHTIGSYISVHKSKFKSNKLYEIKRESISKTSAKLNWISRLNFFFQFYIVLAWEKNNSYTYIWMPVVMEIFRFF